MIKATKIAKINNVAGNTRHQRFALKTPNLNPLNQIKNWCSEREALIEVRAETDYFEKNNLSPTFSPNLLLEKIF